MADIKSNKTAEKKRRSFIADLVFRMTTEKPLGTAGLIITIIFLATAIFANYLAPYAPNQLHGLSALKGPSLQFWLGTDNLGRDLLSRIIFGARVSVIVGLGASVVASAVEITIGVLAGYIGGTFDLVVQRFVDAVMCFPGLILMMVIISLVGAGVMQTILVLGITWGITGSRLIRSATMSIKENMYVQAAVSVGSSTPNIIFDHIIPNIMAPIIVQFTTRIPAIILTEASLSFLGFGIPPPAVSWGAMLSGSARTYMYKDPWMAFWPGLALSLVVYGVSMFGDALRDLLDPRLRGGIGRYGTKVKRKPKEIAIQH
ncbi:MAG TPA: ABC transporter permease [Dehalococcoidales bacterium]|jgi:peptide/nickel transport system permease protein|nr:ABC transporter permease [Dehalococcoidales bacterium]